MWEMSRRLRVVFDIRAANVTADLGIMAIGLTGTVDEIALAVAWLRRQGVQADPI
jgi:NIL domain